MKPACTRRPSAFATTLVWMMLGVYLLFSVGILKATHFCMGREASVSYFTAEAKKCPCTLFAKDESDCCNDEHSLLKLENSQKNLKTFSLSLPSLTLIGELSEFDSERLHVKLPVFTVFRSGLFPPPKILFKIYCSYVFYDDKSLT
jgi:hypothetical protein